MLNCQRPGCKFVIFIYRHRCSRYSFIVKSTPVLRAQCNTYSRTVKETGQLGSHLTAVMLNNCAPVSIFIQFRMDFGCKCMFMHISSLGHSLYTTSQSWKGGYAYLPQGLKGQLYFSIPFLIPEYIFNMCIKLDCHDISDKLPFIAAIKRSCHRVCCHWCAV